MKLPKLLAIVLVGLVAAIRFDSNFAADPPTLLEAPVRGTITPVRDTAVVRATEKTTPSIVNLAVSEKTGKSTSWGTGIIVHESGLLITAHHVVATARRIKATLDDGTSLDALLVAALPAEDIALLRLATDKKLTPMMWGHSSEARLGETVLAIGNSFGRGTTVTQGILSQKRGLVELVDGQKFADLLQSDASLHVGMSGGPLVNLDGQMIGLNLFVRSDEYDIAYALATDKMKASVTKLLAEAARP